ncbi:MAG TPA: lytic transglycosylase [Cryomorphaceae bacterium]|nr:lytic transglycosylase [Cryomorphaceae bacterium]|tara:strand:- start:2296 stop:3591 length:1296 start_codon:yes stop_codon:yes gene_type:complete
MDSKAINIRVLSPVFAGLLTLSTFGQEAAVDSYIAVADSALAPTTDLDSVALYALDERLARLDSEHLMFAFHNLPKVDTISPLPLTDSVFEHYMAELDAKTPFEMIYNPVVKRYLERYLKYGTARLSRMMAHGQYYFPMFEEHLDKYDIPLEIKYLAVVESALNPKAQSYVGATGLWQFMYSTGKLYDLKVNSYVDDRNDPLKSTEAACQYMLKMYDVFEDWNLVLAAYNSGPGNVRKAIRRSGGKTSYWEIRPFLPRETSAYVPLFIAATYAMEYGNLYGIGPADIPVYYLETDTVRVTQQLHFKQIQEELGVEEALMEFLNPQYKYNIVPVVKGQDYCLSLPKDAANHFRIEQDSIYKIAESYFESRASSIPDLIQMNKRTVHRIKSGETLGHIAGKYGVRVSEIKRWNGLKSDMIRVGQRIVVYPRRL